MIKKLFFPIQMDQQLTQICMKGRQIEKTFILLLEILEKNCLLYGWQFGFNDLNTNLSLISI